MQDYGDSLEKTPFYRYKYLPWVKKFWSGFADSWKQARAQESAAKLFFIGNVVAGTVLTVEMIARWAFSAPINLFYGDTDEADARFIRLIVKGGTESPRFKQINEKISVIPSFI